MSNLGSFFIDFRICINCGIWFQIQSSLFCKTCTRKLFLWSVSNTKETLFIKDCSFPLYSLFQWTPNENRPLSSLLAALKGGYPKDAFHYYAEKFVENRWKEESLQCLQSASMIIPAPSSQRLPWDHALALAQPLSRILQIPMVTPFHIMDRIQPMGNDADNRNPGQQKRKNKMERLSTEQNGPKLSGYSQFHVLFIDDIVTTGQTALKAYELLGRPLGFEVWCLARRRLTKKQSELPHSPLPL